MVSIWVSEDARKAGIINPVACVIKGVQVEAGGDELNLEIQSLMNRLAEDPNQILERDEVRGFSLLFEALGYPKQIPAGRRLVSSFIKRGFKRYNNIVDACNIASATFGSGLGLHDAARVTADVRVYRAEGTEKIIPLFEGGYVEIPKGDLVYRSGGELMAWLGKKDVDSNEFKVTDLTTEVFLIALGNSQTSLEYNKKICRTVFDLIALTCPHATIELVPST